MAHDSREGKITLTPEQKKKTELDRLREELDLKDRKIASDKAAQTSTADRLASEIKQGQEVLGKDFEEGKLGRLDAERSTDIKDVIERRRAGLEGLSAQENQALRERGKAGIQRGTQTALRQLRGRQASSGVRGGTALAQQSNILTSGAAQEANVERDLFIQNIEQKRRALGDFEGSVVGAEGSEQSRNVFNLRQRGREVAGRLSAGLGFAQLNVAERAGKKAIENARQNVPPKDDSCF